jgi:hypothetical protein
MSSSAQTAEESIAHLVARAASVCIGRRLPAMTLRIAS